MSKNSYGLQSIDNKISHLLKPIFLGSKKEFIMINNLIKNWDEIIGKKYAKFCYAKSVSFSKDKSSGKLTIAVYNPAVGFFLDNSSELIIERIASFYGYKSITKIIICQEPKSLENTDNNIVKLDETKENFLQDKINEIADKDLAETLQKLGREIFRKN